MAVEGTEENKVTQPEAKLQFFKNPSASDGEEKKKDTTMVDREAAANDQTLPPTSPNLTDTIDLPPLNLASLPEQIV